MTKVLIISNKSDVTSDFIVRRLKERGIDFYRFNTEELTKTCAFTIDSSSDILYLTDLNNNQKYNLREFTSVYYRRPELPSLSNLELNISEERFVKNEIAYTLEGIYKILRKAYWISPVYSIREAENKIYQLEIAKSLGFRIPQSIITNSYEDFLNFYEKTNNKCVIKPIKSGLIEDLTNSKVIFTSAIKEKPASTKRFEISPNYFQELICKKGDVRVTVVGKTVFATFIHSQEDTQTKIDWRMGQKPIKHTKILLPALIQAKCVKLLSILNLKFGAIDFILDENDDYVFLEINPNGQWAWIEKQTGYKISDEIVNLLENENF